MLPIAAGRAGAGVARCMRMPAASQRWRRVRGLRACIFCNARKNRARMLTSKKRVIRFRATSRPRTSRDPSHRRTIERRQGARPGRGVGDSFESATHVRRTDPPSPTPRVFFRLHPRCRAHRCMHGYPSDRCAQRAGGRRRVRLPRRHLKLGSKLLSSRRGAIPWP